MERNQQRQQCRFDASVQEILRDEQITSDSTIFKVDTHSAHFTEDAHVALLDTGASIPVIPLHVVSDLQLALITLDNPTRVSMANGAIEHIHQVVDLGPIIGFAAVLKSATQTLIGLGPLMEQGYEVHFAKTGVGIFLHNKLIYKGFYDPKRKLFQINIMDLILPSSPPDQPQIQEAMLIGSNIPLRLSSDDKGNSDNDNEETGVPVTSRKKRINERQTETIDPAMIKEALWLHKRMGHPSRQVMMKAIAHHAWTGIPVGLTPSIIDSVFHHIECTACALGKRNRVPREKGTGIHPVHPGHTLSFDYQPVSTPSITGHTGYFLFKCLCSGYRHAVLTNSKGTIALKEAIASVIKWYKKYGFIVSKLRFDSGATEKGYELKEFLTEQDIDYSPAAVNSQFQNPVEREVQTVNKGVATLFADQHLLNSSFWTYALNHWILSANATPISGEISPVEQVTGRSIDISRMFRFPFGCPVTSTKEQAKVAFPSVKSEMGICLGAYAENDKSILLYIPGRRLKEFPRMNVQTLKVNFPPHPKSLDVQPVYDDLLQVEYKSPINRQSQLLGTQGFQHFSKVFDDMDSGDMFPAKPSASPSIPSLGSESAPPPQYWFEKGGSSDPLSSSEQKSSSLVEGVSWLSNQFETSFSISARTDDNPSMAKALRNWERWSIPADKEMTMLRDLDLYEEVNFDDVPQGVQILPTKMDFKSKYDSMGKFIKDKARLVVLGNLEWETLQDYFSPTAHSKTLNLLLAMAVEHNFILFGLDIYGAFITADIDEPVYVSLPKGLPTKHGTGRIWKLKKTLYGLKRSPRAFFDSLSAYLLSKGYFRSAYDPCLFFRRTSPTEVIVFCIHVDDFAIAASHHYLIQQLKNDLRDNGYIITESDTLETFLGVHIHSQRSGIYLSQPGHLAKIFECVKESNKGADTPMSADFSDIVQDNSPLLSRSKDAPEDKSLEYFQHLLGMIMFVVRTRPDIAYAVNRMAMRTSKATEKDIKALARIAAYLYETRHLELVYSKGTGSPSLYAYSDASFISHSDGKSHMGFCIGYGSTSGFFYARSAKQKMITLSSTESETYSAVEATKDLLYFRSVLTELGFPLDSPSSIRVDNKSLIELATSFSGNHKRVRHFLVRIHFLMEQVKDKTITMDYVDTAENIADQLTKPITGSAFVRGRESLMGPQRVKLAW